MTTRRRHEKSNAGKGQSFAVPTLAWILVILGLLLWWVVEIQPLAEWVLTAVYLIGLAAVVLSFRLFRSAEREWVFEDTEMEEACENSKYHRAEKIPVAQRESKGLIRICGKCEIIHYESWDPDRAGSRMERS